MLTYTFVIPSSKQKHRTGSLTHTHTRMQHTTPTTTKKTQLGMLHCLLMVIWLAQMLLLCEKLWSLWVIKKEIILLTLDWLWGHPKALIQWRHVSSVCVGLANGTKGTPTQNWGNLLSELHVPHSAWPAFLIFLMLFCFFFFFYWYLSIFVMGSLYP